MAWVSPKVYAILSNSEEGKDILVGIADKSQDEVDREVDAFFKNGKGKKEEKEEPSNTILKSTTSDEKKVISNMTKYLWQGTRGNPRDESIIERLNDSIDKLPDEYSDIINEAMQKTIDHFYQEKGQGYYDYSKKVIVIDRNDLFNNYDFQPLSVFYHEVGHSVDRLFGKKAGNFWISNSYKSEKYQGATLADMIMSEAGDYDADTITNLMREEDEVFEKPRKEKMAELIDNREEAYANYSSARTEKTKLRNELYKQKYGDIPSENVYAYRDYLMESEAKKLGYGDYFSVPYDGRKKIKDFVDEKTNEYREFEDKLKENDPEYEYLCSKVKKAREVFDKACDEERKFYCEPKRAYGDCADLIGGAHGQVGTISAGMKFGHDSKYWGVGTYRKEMLGNECFAEMFDGVTNNKASYYNMKKMFPKSVEIFEEILKKYGH